MAASLKVLQGRNLATLNSQVMFQINILDDRGASSLREVFNTARYAEFLTAVMVILSLLVLLGQAAVVIQDVRQSIGFSWALSLIICRAIAWAVFN